jgi:hypothetical protein
MKKHYSKEWPEVTIQPPAPWKWFDATPSQWHNQGELISLASSKGISMVFVWGADNSKKIKMRPCQSYSS